jgi:hypothetical protein
MLELPESKRNLCLATLRRAPEQLEQNGTLLPPVL